LHLFRTALVNITYLNLPWTGKIGAAHNEARLQPRRYQRITREPKFFEDIPGDPPIALERIPTDDNTDELTRNTVQKMCALIKDSATDPIVQRCAAYAKKYFARGSNDPAMLAWGVFWYVKHCVKFRSDEGTMMQVGEQALDLLTAPAVLVRMQNPSEDCDGFTMLSAAMLTILGVPVYVTTVATDLDDPRRWSHVFLCANVNGRIIPLDTSHGKAPGWMVPNNRINRWQTWTLDGRPADVKIPNYRGLHGYVGGRGSGALMMPRALFARGRGFGGLGLCTTQTDEAGNTTEYCDDTTTTPPVSGCPVGQSDYGGGCVPTSQTQVNLGTGPITPAQAGLTPAQIAQLIAATGNASVSLIRTAAGGPYTVAGTNLIYNPATGQLVSGSNPYGLNLSSFPASITQNIPLILGAVAAILILPSLLGGRR
jgi:hypothetical protein